MASGVNLPHGILGVASYCLTITWAAKIGESDVRIDEGDVVVGVGWENKKEVGAFAVRPFLLDFIPRRAVLDVDHDA